MIKQVIAFDIIDIQLVCVVLYFYLFDIQLVEDDILMRNPISFSIIEILIVVNDIQLVV